MIFKKKLWLCRLPFVNFFKNGPHFAKTAPILQFLRFRTKYFARRYLLYMSLMEYTQKIRKIGPTILFNPKKGVGPLWPPPSTYRLSDPPVLIGLSKKDPLIFKFIRLNHQLATKRELHYSAKSTSAKVASSLGHLAREKS